jgi:hypothetical protein
MTPAQMQVPQILQNLERRHLETAITDSRIPFGSYIQTIPYLRVLGQARFWENNPAAEMGYESHLEDVITGFHGQGYSIGYLVLGDDLHIEIHLGMKGDDQAGLLRSALHGTFPGIRLSAAPDINLGSNWHPGGIFRHVGRLTGIPTRKSGVQTRIRTATENLDQGRSFERGRLQQVERLLRALMGDTWGYLVWASPIANLHTIAVAQTRLNQLTDVSTQIHSQENLSQTISQKVDDNTQSTTAQARTIDHTDRWAQHAVKLLEYDQSRYELGKAQGMWNTEVYYFASRMEVLRKVNALVRAIFAGEDSVPDPIRTFIGSNEGGTSPADTFITPLTSSEVATLCQLPREEFPGYQVTDYARFDIDVPIPSGEAVALGKVLDGGQPTGSWFSIPRQDFAKHGLVVGVTGSGKTNTMFYLLDRLWNKGNGVPFLVIEPAKTEYRDLAPRPEFAGNLRIYTLGDERFAPFRINPFVFEIFDLNNRIHVQTHIDFLKSVFNAAFILYAPMPYVLETCLHEIYQDKGWDLTTGQNRRLPLKERGHEDRWPVFPTLTDLYNKIEEVVDQLGYEERITRDVKAGLKARIGSLRLGGKGLMLDTSFGVSMQSLLSKPTILELERVGNDDEKAFLIGLVLTRLYEYRILQGKQSSGQLDLQHVAVFEEAHRLLKNTNTDVGTEEANTKAQAVESFANMLSEIRAYGQGMLIAEQIPTKLAPDAIKNTNLKIMHRVVAADDRAVMGGAMNLDEDQLRFVSALSAGHAVAFAEGADHPYLIKVLEQPEKQKGKKSRFTDLQVKQIMSSICSGEIYASGPGFNRHLSNLSPDEMPLVRDLSTEVIEADGFTERFSRYFLSLILSPVQAIEGLPGLQTQIKRQISGIDNSLMQSVLVASLLYAIHYTLEDRGRRYRWLYNVSSTLFDQLIDPLIKLVKQYENKAEVVQRLSAQSLVDLKPFIEAYHDRTRRKLGPLAGCTDCRAACLYRWDVHSLLTDKTLEREFVNAIQSPKDDQAMWQQMSRVAQNAAGRLLNGNVSPHDTGVAICFAAQMTARLNFSANTQRKATHNIRIVLEKKERKGQNG